MDGLWNPLLFFIWKSLPGDIRHRGCLFIQWSLGEPKSLKIVHPARWISSCFTNLMNCVLVGGFSPTQLKNMLVKLYHIARDLGENNPSIWVALRVILSWQTNISPRLQAWQIWWPRSRPRNTDWCISEEASPLSAWRLKVLCFS